MVSIGCGYTTDPIENEARVAFRGEEADLRSTRSWTRLRDSHAMHKRPWRRGPW
jgi:hypothetical protein